MPKPTIVLVHGAWADASSWNAVATELQSQDFTVLAPPNLLRGVGTDAAVPQAPSNRVHPVHAGAAPNRELRCIPMPDSLIRGVALFAAAEVG